MDLSNIKYSELLISFGKVAVPLAVGTLAIRKKDWKGVGYLAVAIAVNEIIVPDMTKQWFSQDSQPSKHTARAFIGAGFLITRYGMTIADPSVISAAAFATLVGGARLYLKGYTWDNLCSVVTGAIIGGLVSSAVPHR